jgi:Septin
LDEPDWLGGIIVGLVSAPLIGCFYLLNSGGGCLSDTDKFVYWSFLFLNQPIFWLEMDSNDQRTVRDDDERSIPYSNLTGIVGPTGSSTLPPSSSGMHSGYTLMVAGQRTGKTSFLRLLLDTSDISQMATKDQLTSIARFVQGSSGHTSHIRTASVDIELDTQGSGVSQRLTLSLVDTPSLDFSDDSASERLVSELLRYVDARFSEGIDDVIHSPTLPSYSFLISFISFTFSRTGKLKTVATMFICEFSLFRFCASAANDYGITRCIYFLDPNYIVPPAVPGLPAPLVPRARTNSFTQPEPEPVILEPPVTTNPLLCRPTLPPAEINTIRRLSARVNVLPVVARADTLTNDRLAAVKMAIRRDLAEAGIGFGIFDMDGHYHHLKDDHSAQPVNGDPSNGYNVITNGSSSAATSPPATPATPSLLRLPYALISPDVYSHSDGVTRIPLPRHELVHQYTPSSHSSSSNIVRGKFIRSFRWGNLDVLDPNHCDFMPLRAAIFHHMEVCYYVCFFSS